MSKTTPARTTSKKKKRPKPQANEFPPAEQDLGGGDICSIEEEPSTEDDKPLD